MPRTAGLCAFLLVLSAGIAPASGQGEAEPQDTVMSDTLTYFSRLTETSNADLAVALSQDTPLTDVQTVMLGRDDLFADSLASGVAQGSSPLLLVPPQGPVPASVLAELQRLDPAQVVLLGGPAAISDAVATELQASFDVARAFGGSRIETAVAVAQRFAPGAQTAIVARAFDAGTGDPTQAFADALAAGALAADLGAQVLLTESAQLSSATRDHMIAAGLQRVVIVGGTAAVSQAVEDELLALVPDVERLAGAGRAETAIAIAEARGFPGAGSAARVMLADSRGAEAWAAGFTAASHAALFDAPMLLTDGASIPPATQAFLESSGAQFAGADEIRLVCLLDRDGCLAGRAALGLPPHATVTFMPASGAVVAPGGTVRVTVAPPGRVNAIRVSGDCVGQLAIVVEDAGGYPVDLASPLPVGGCTLIVENLLEDGLVQLDTVAYVTGDAATPILVSELAAGGPAGGDRPTVSADGGVVAFASAGQVVAGVDNDRVHVYVDDGSGPVLIDTEDAGPSDEGLDTTSAAPQLTADGSVIAFATSDEDLDPSVTPTALSAGYVADVATGAITLISLSVAGDPSNGEVVDISDDGTVVTYRQQVEPGGEGRRLLRRDLVGGAIAMLDTHADDFQSIVLSGDGRFSVFSSDQVLVPGDTNATHDTYLYDWQSDAYELLSVTSTGEASPVRADDGRPLSVSADGRYVTFTSTAPLVPTDDAQGQQDVYLRDRQAGTTSVLTGGASASGGTGVAGSVSRNGQWAAFASNKVDGTCGVFRYAIATGELQRLDDPATATFANCATATVVADDGTVVATASQGYRPDDPIGTPDIYRFG